MATTTILPLDDRFFVMLYHPIPCVPFAYSFTLTRNWWCTAASAASTLFSPLSSHLHSTLFVTFILIVFAVFENIHRYRSGWMDGNIYEYGKNLWMVNNSTRSAPLGRQRQISSEAFKAFMYTFVSPFFPFFSLFFFYLVRCIFFFFCFC